MKRIVKTVAIVLAAVLAVAIIVPIALRGKIGDIVKTEANKMLTGRLDFEKLDISLLRHFPHASIELDGLVLTGAGEFENDTVVAADCISVVVDLMSLFGDSGFEVSKLILSAPRISALKTAEGNVNWDLMKPTEPSETEDEESEPSSFRLQMKDLRVERAQLSFIDDSSRVQFAAAPLDIRLKGDMSADMTDLTVTATSGGLYFSNGGVALLNGADAELRATVEADMKNGRYTLSDNLIRLNAISMSLDGWVQTSDSAVDMDLRLNSERIGFRELLSMIPAFYTRDFKNLTASGDMQLSAWAKGTMQGDRLPAFDVQLSVSDGSFKYAALPRSVDGINIEARAVNDGGTADDTRVEVSRFGLTLAGNSLAATLSASTPVSDLNFKATADGKIDLGAVKEVYPLGDSVSLSGTVTADISVAGRMSDIERERYESIDAQGRLTVENMTAHLSGIPEVRIDRASASISPAAMTLSELDVKVGRSDLKASGSLSNYLGYAMRGDMLKGRLGITSSLLDANELIGGESAGDWTEESAETAEPETGGDMSAVKVPENLDLSMTAEIGKILFAKMDIENFAGELNVKGGTVDMKRLSMNAFGGSMSASGTYSTAGEYASSPALGLSAAISGASFSRTFDELDMIKTIVPIFEKTGGDYSMKLDMTARMTESMGVDPASVNAEGSISSANINIQNIKVLEVLATTLGNEKLRTIEARDVTVPFRISEGRLSTSPFDIKMGNISMNLSGTTGLDQSIDYTAKVALPEGTAGGYVQNVNVLIGGTFSSPKITLGVKDMIADALKNTVATQITGKLTGTTDNSEQIEKLRAEADAAAAKLVEAAEQQRDKLVEAAKNPIAKIAAQKSGDALVLKAEQQAEKLRAEAEKKIEALQGGQNE